MQIFAFHFVEDLTETATEKERWLKEARLESNIFFINNWKPQKRKKKWKLLFNLGNSTQITLIHVAVDRKAMHIDEQG